MRIDRPEQRVFSLNEKLVLFLLLLSFVDFFSYSLHLMVIAAIVFWMLNRRIYLINSLVPAILLTVSMILSGTLTVTSPTSWMIHLVWPMATIAGFGMIYVSRDIADAEKRLNTCIGIAAIGFFAHLMLNLYANAGRDDLGRNTLDFWSKEVYAATGQAGLACVPMAWCVASFLKEKKFSRRFWSVVAILAMLYYNLTLGSRTMIYSLFIVFAVAIFYLLKREEYNKKKTTTFFVTVGIVIAVLIAYNTDAWGVRSLIEESTLFERLLGDQSLKLGEDARWSSKLAYLKLMPQYLTGGNHIYRLVGSYAHDVLLDTYDQYGLLALVAVVALLWDAISKLLKLLRSKQLQEGAKITLLCVYITVLLTFAVEPVLEGMPWLMMSFCFIYGMVAALTKKACSASAKPNT